MPCLSQKSENSCCYGRVFSLWTLNWVSASRGIGFWTSHHMQRYFSYICDGASICAAGLKKKLDLQSGSQRHRHFAEFLNAPVKAPTQGQLFTVIPRNRLFQPPFTTRISIRRTYSRLNTQRSQQEMNVENTSISRPFRSLGRPCNSMENIGYLWNAIARDCFFVGKLIIYHSKEDIFNFLMI